GPSVKPSTSGSDQPNPPELATFSSPGPLRLASVPPERIYPITHEINGVDVAAPGAHILSARANQIPAATLASLTQQRLAVNARGLILRGTSMATPIITGLIANLLAETPNL